MNLNLSKKVAAGGLALFTLVGSMGAAEAHSNTPVCNWPNNVCTIPGHHHYPDNNKEVNYDYWNPIVKEGDSFYYFAQTRYGRTDNLFVWALAYTCGYKSDKAVRSLQIGTQVNLPHKDDMYKIYAVMNDPSINLWALYQTDEKRKSSTVTMTDVVMPRTATNGFEPLDLGTYIVREPETDKKGKVTKRDTLTRIAERFTSDGVVKQELIRAIRERNNIKNDTIIPNQILFIPYVNGMDISQINVNLLLVINSALLEIYPINGQFMVMFAEPYGLEDTEALTRTLTPNK